MVNRTLLLLPLACACVSAFTGDALVSRRPAFQQSSLQMGGAGGASTTLAGKTATISKVKGLLENSEMVFTIPAGAITVAQSQSLRRSMPEGTSIIVVKNKLMEIAVRDTDFAAATSMLKGANMWFFVEEDIGASIKAYNAFTKLTAKKESHPILGGVIDNTAYDGPGVESIGKLPSKLELYAQIAGAIQAVPTKVARVIKAPNSKLARAIKLATTPEE
jgi:large subunit ribosomal protein L10